MKNEGSTSPGAPNLRLLDGRHEELITSLPNLAPKLAAVRLLDHLSSLPHLSASSQALFYHVDGTSRLCRLILEPVPFSGHIGFLQDLRSLLDAAVLTAAGDKIPELSSARGRLAIILAAELGIRGQWEDAVSVIAPMTEGGGLKIPEGQDRDLLSSPIIESWKQNFSAFLDFLSDLDSSPPPMIHTPSPATPDHPIQWPYHLLDPERQIPKESVLTVLVDGEEIPAHYHEAYLATLSVRVLVRKREHVSEPIVKARDSRGEEIPLGEELKGLVREGVKRSLMLLGPSAQARARKARMEVEVLLLRPSIIAEVHGRSILLPLVLILSRQLGEQLNLSGVIYPSRDVVWTGEVDDHGNVIHVSSLREKAERVVASRASGMAYPAEDDEELGQVLQKNVTACDLARFPIAHAQDLVVDSDIIAIRARSIAARIAFDLKRKTRPLGLAGSAAVGVLLIGLALAIPRLASWLDTAVVEACHNMDEGYLELLNSRGRIVKRFSPGITTTCIPKLGDVDGDGANEVFIGTDSSDSLAGTLFCFNADGQELWRFHGGFQPGEMKPYPLENTFAASDVFVRDLDKDSINEVIAVFTHRPWYAAQLAFLSPGGRYRSSFWNPGHIKARRPHEHGPQGIIFADIDNDGFEEVLAGATNNSNNRAAIVILDPRSLEGRGFQCGKDIGVPKWQSYVLLPEASDFRDAMAATRFSVRSLDIQEWKGKKAISVGFETMVPDMGMIQAWNCILDFDFNVIDFYIGDSAIAVIKKARRAGTTDFDPYSPEFQEAMIQVEVIPGPPELLLP